MRKEMYSRSKGIKSFRIYFFAEKEGTNTAKKYRYLDFKDRERIEALKSDGFCPREIATEIGAHVSTVYRELHRGQVSEHSKTYDPKLAQSMILKSFKRRGKKHTGCGDTKN